MGLTKGNRKTGDFAFGPPLEAATARQMLFQEGRTGRFSYEAFSGGAMHLRDLYLGS